MKVDHPKYKLCDFEVSDILEINFLRSPTFSLPFFPDFFFLGPSFQRDSKAMYPCRLQSYSLEPVTFKTNKQTQHVGRGFFFSVPLKYQQGLNYTLTPGGGLWQWQLEGAATTA